MKAGACAVHDPMVDGNDCLLRDRPIVPPISVFGYIRMDVYSAQYSESVFRAFTLAWRVMRSRNRRPAAGKGWLDWLHLSRCRWRRELEVQQIQRRWQLLCKWIISRNGKVLAIVNEW